MLESTTQQPKILRRMVYRFAALMLVLAVAVAAYMWYAQWSKDIDLPEQADTAGWIAAIQHKPEGSQVVVIRPDGSLLPSPGYRDGVTDKDLAWRPDGHRLFFVSDREDQATNVFRWNFGANRVMRRSYNSRSKAKLAFLPPGAKEANKTALMVSGKNVVEFHPVDGATWQVLPPIDKERAVSEELSGSLMQQAYDTLGESFREAKWTPDKSAVVCVMRTDTGELLLVQPLGPDARPIPVVAGSHIDFDVHPKTGRVFYTVNDFRPLNLDSVPKEYIKNGRLALPFHHLIGWTDPDKLATDPSTASGTLIASKLQTESFRSIVISPDGEELAFVAMRRDKQGDESAVGLVVMPSSGQAPGALVHQATVAEPSWKPDGLSLLFLSPEANGDMAIWTVNRDGSALRQVTKGLGSFASPRYSPQSTGG